MHLKQTLHRYLQILFCIAALILGVSVLTTPTKSGWSYIARVDCAHLDVAEGLYKSLRSSVSSPGIPGDEGQYHGVLQDSSLTNSEISILTQYAESQVASAPQFITTSLWNWCYGDYNTTVYFDRHGRLKHHMENQVLTCFKSRDDLLDYRNELEQIGLQAILAYAFKSSQYEDSAYAKSVSSRSRRFRYVVPGILFGVVSQLVVVVASLAIFWHGRKHKKNVPTPIIHGVALLTVASCLASSISAGIVTQLVREIQKEIRAHLDDFGVFLHLGRLWFSLLWATVVLSSLSMFSWALPVWCANPAVDDDEYYEEVSLANAVHEEQQHRIKDMFHLHRHSKNEVELRRLGEKLSQKASVRRTKSGKATDESKGLLDEEAPAHYRETTYDGYHESTRGLSSSESVLNDEEMAFMDQGYLGDERMNGALPSELYRGSFTERSEVKRGGVNE